MLVCLTEEFPQMEQSPPLQRSRWQCRPATARIPRIPRNARLIHAIYSVYISKHCESIFAEMLAHPSCQTNHRPHFGDGPPSQYRVSTRSVGTKQRKEETGRICAGIAKNNRIGATTVVSNATTAAAAAAAAAAATAAVEM